MMDVVIVLVAQPFVKTFPHFTILKQYRHKTIRCPYDNDQEGDTIPQLHGAFNPLVMKMVSCHLHNIKPS